MALPDAKEYGVRAIQSQHNWDQWSRIELFRRELFEEDTRVLYFDLDMVIVGSLEEVAGRKEPWIVLGDFYRRPPNYDKIHLASGMMMWTGNDQEAIYK